MVIRTIHQTLFTFLSILPTHLVSFISYGKLVYPTTDQITIAYNVGRDVVDKISAMAFGDFDENGQLDIVMATVGAIYWTSNLGNEGQLLSFDNPPQLIIQDGDSIGTADGSTTYVFRSEEITTMSVMDMNNDGHVDIVAGNRYHTMQDANTAVLVLFNDGTGSFQPRISLESQGIGGPTKTFSKLNVDDIKLADFNNDGLNDIAVTGWAHVTDPNEQYGGFLIYMENNGSGDFTTRNVISEDLKQLNKLVVADYDQNGTPDIAVLSFGRSMLWIYSNDGNANFVGTVIDNSAIANRGIASGDVDSDGDPDIVCIHEPYLIRYINNGAATFEEIIMHDEPNINSDGFNTLIHDVDGDGLNDIVAGPRFPRRYVWYKQSIQGTFITEPENFGQISGSLFAFADISGDGIDDIVWAAGSSIYAIIATESNDDPVISNPCSPNPFPDNRMCEDIGEGKYQCYSTDGPCLHEPCETFESCLELADGGYVCVYNDPCESNPCEQGMDCIDDGQGKSRCEMESIACNWFTWLLQFLVGWLGFFFCNL